MKTKIALLFFLFVFSVGYSQMAIKIKTLNDTMASVTMLNGDKMKGEIVAKTDTTLSIRTSDDIVRLFRITSGTQFVDGITRPTSDTLLLSRNHGFFSTNSWATYLGGAIGGYYTNGEGGFATNTNFNIVIHKTPFSFQWLYADLGKTEISQTTTYGSQTSLGSIIVTLFSLGLVPLSTTPETITTTLYSKHTVNSFQFMSGRAFTNNTDVWFEVKGGISLSEYTTTILEDVTTSTSANSNTSESEVGSHSVYTLGLPVNLNLTFAPQSAVVPYLSLMGELTSQHTYYGFSLGLRFGRLRLRNQKALSEEI